MTGQATRDFALQIDSEWAAMQGDIRDAIMIVANEAVERSKQKSPVDLGTFRANWVLSIGEPDTSTTTDLAGFATKNAGALAAYAAADGFPIIFVSNNLPYALRLENGWSGQAPNGILALTVVELEALWNGMQV
ncbi:hypothetical protein K7H20_13770 [Salipiger manganoxidans]|uniref:hypothetical protein n=1 Tax=Salipiger marinus TaxID=555512 RepID=UPI001E651A87|nr:hypothetical protein [Salipiger manganoxidans]MCD1619133.1 hypothetical protein [Salipiger manganoxidans]